MKTAISSPPIRALIVEDETDLRNAWVDYLQLEGIEAHGLASLKAAQAWVHTHDFDVLLLDLTLPDDVGKGMQWLCNGAALQDKGVIVTTDHSDTLSRIDGMRSGADAYLVKPVAPEEIHLLVRKLARRLRNPAPGQWLLDDTAWQLHSPSGNSVKLTHSELLLLRRLAQSCGQPVTRDDLARSLGHDPQTYDLRRLEIMVRRLRKKINDCLGIRLPLETAHRKGLAFTSSLKCTSAPLEV